MIPNIDKEATNQPWLITLRSCQDEVATLSMNLYYVQRYRRSEFYSWTHIARWIYGDALKAKPGMCLDIGCAYGTLLLYTSRLSDCRAFGIDMTTAYMSRSLVAKYDLHFAVSNIELDPLPWDHSFDVIIFTEVLEHLNFQAVPTLKKIRLLLSDNGKLYLSTPDAAQWGRVSKYYSSYKLMPLPSEELRTHTVDDHVWHFSQDELFDVVQSAGLKIVRFDFAPGVAGRHFNLTLKGLR